MDVNERKRNIFVLGYDERHAEDLQQIPDSGSFQFFSLLHSDELVHQEKYNLDGLIDKARKILAGFDRPVDGIVCHWDFPATSIAAILCAELGLPSPSLEAVLKCSHKYWSRLEQAKVTPENTPAFCAIDPFADDPMAALTLEFPFWLKPIKGYSSSLGFRINDAAEFQRAIAIIRTKIKRIGSPFNTVLNYVELPPEVAEVTGNHLIAEQLMHGTEFAPEGSVQHGHFNAHGVIDMVRGKNQKSFLRYEYPSQVPRRIQQRGIEVAQKVLNQVGFDNGCFNMEFFWDQATDKLMIIEINPRISQSHSYQFEKVDGMSNHEIAVHVAMGDEPHFSHGGGAYKHAAKFLLREYRQGDARVIRVPGAKDLEKLARLQPDTDVVIKVREGQRLSTLLDQDAYSYVLAEVHVAANTPHDMIASYHQAAAMLPFEFEPEAPHEAA